MLRAWLTFAICLSGASLGMRCEPAEAISIEFDVRVPMRDGINLAADVYRPSGDGRCPVILLRTPYLKNDDTTLRQGRYFAAHGYVYVVMDVRGRGDSEGVFRPYRNEGVDGYDSIEWCARQKWSTGKVGTIGRSYTAYDQWLAAVLQPPHLAAMISTASMTDPFGDVWISGPGGLPTPTMISWYHLTAGRVLQNMRAVDWEKLNWHLPLYTIDEAGGRPSEAWKEIIAHSTLDDWWAPMRYQNQFARVQVPVLNISGWYDDALRAAPMNFAGIRRESNSQEIKDNQRLVVGPWPHATNADTRLGALDFGPSAVIDLDRLELDWFDRWLKGAPGRVDDSPVKLFVMGRNQWTSASDWPVPGTRFQKFFLHSGGKANALHGDGRLSTSAPENESADRYLYDPANPTPFLTEPSFAQLGGPDDYRAVEQRDDVLVYTSDTLDRETVVCGPLKTVVYAESSARGTDFTAKLLDVWPDGFAQRLNDGMVRARFRDGLERPSLIDPGKVYRYEIDLWSTCQAFLPGHRIRLELSSSAFPKFDRNPNTGSALGRDAAMEVAKQAVYHDREHGSYVELPVVGELTKITSFSTTNNTDRGNK